jgi:hypothetical protein
MKPTFLEVSRIKLFSIQNIHKFANKKNILHVTLLKKSVDKTIKHNIEFNKRNFINYLRNVPYEKVC